MSGSQNPLFNPAVLNSPDNPQQLVGTMNQLALGPMYVPRDPDQTSTVSAGAGVPPKLPTRPPSEDVGRAMNATFTYGKDLGNRTVPIEQLTGGTTSSTTEAPRVATLKDQMLAPDGYISRLIVDSKGNVIEGQHRLEALRQLGVTQVPVRVIHDLSSGVDTAAMDSAIRGAQTMHGDQRKQLIGHVLDALHTESGSVPAVRDGYEPPSGYGAAWNAALGALQ